MVSGTMTNKNDINIDIILEQDLSNITKVKYTQKLRRLEKICKKTIKEIMISPRESLKNIKRYVSIEPGTIAANITPICKLFTINNTFKMEHEQHYKTWSKYLTHYNKKRVKIYDEEGLKPKQLENIVSFKDIENKFYELQNDKDVFQDIKKHLQYILLAMLIHIRPKRCDLGDVYISLNGSIPKSYLEKNYILLSENNSTLVINRYKTQKQHGKIVEPLSDKLTKILKDSVERFPRKHLFISLDPRLKNKPYELNNSYGRFVFSVFEKLFNKKIGASLWRHIYISDNVDFNDRYPDLVNNARLSGQTLATQMQIYKIHNKPK